MVGKPRYGLHCALVNQFETLIVHLKDEVEQKKKTELLHFARLEGLENQVDVFL